ncbi:MAG: hypothetical protein ACE5LU_30110 [Anaerolineae bacterium]
MNSVEAYNPYGERAGCVEVIIPGFYPYMRVYREEQMPAICPIFCSVL